MGCNGLRRDGGGKMQGANMTRLLKGAGNSNREQAGWPQPAASPESLQMRGPGSCWASSPWKSLLKQRRNQFDKKRDGIDGHGCRQVQHHSTSTREPLPVAFLGPRIGRMERHRAAKRCRRTDSEPRERRTEITNAEGDLSSHKRKAQKCNEGRQQTTEYLHYIPGGQPMLLVGF